MKEGRRNRYYWTCAACGSNLDHSERCNCAETKTASPRADRLLPKANTKQNSNGTQQKDMTKSEFCQSFSGG